MSFRITTLLYLFALVAASLAVFGAWGILLAFVLYWAWATKMPGAAWSCLSLILLCIGGYEAGLGPAIGAARDSAELSYCLNNGRSISIAILDYEAANGRFPPPYTIDPDGRPLHSWRVLILPYIGPVEKALYDKIHLDEPWDSEHNRQFDSEVPTVYRCPGCDSCLSSNLKHPVSRNPNSSNYYAVIGPDTLWQPDRKVTSASISDDRQSTLMLIEATDIDATWMQPVDVEQSELAARLEGEYSSGHIGSMRQFLTVSESIRVPILAWSDSTVSYANRLQEKPIAPYCTIAGGETLDWHTDASYGGMQRRSHILWFRAYQLLAFVIVATLPAIPAARRRIWPAKEGCANRNAQCSTEDQAPRTGR